MCTDATLTLTHKRSYTGNVAVGASISFCVLQWQCLPAAWDIEQEMNEFDQEMEELMLEFDALDDTSEEYRYAQWLLEHNKELREKVSQMNDIVLRSELKAKKSRRQFLNTRIHSSKSQYPELKERGSWMNQIEDEMWRTKRRVRLLRGIAVQKDPQVETYNKVESELGIHQQDVAMLETQYLTQMMHNK